MHASENERAPRRLPPCPSHRKCTPEPGYVPIWLEPRQAQQRYSSHLPCAAPSTTYLPQRQWQVRSTGGRYCTYYRYLPQVPTTGTSCEAGPASSHYTLETRLRKVNKRLCQKSQNGLPLP